MRLLFKSMISRKADGWPMGFYGNSAIDGEDYCLDTHYLKSDEVPEECMDAKTCSELIAGLLNAFYAEKDVSKMNVADVMRMGRYVEEEDVPKINPNQKEIPF
jgi:hypothetical protein